MFSDLQDLYHPLQDQVIQSVPASPTVWDFTAQELEEFIREKAAHSSSAVVLESIGDIYPTGRVVAFQMDNALMIDEYMWISVKSVSKLWSQFRQKRRNNCRNP